MGEPKKAVMKPRTGKWVPKKWKPVYEEIVALSVMGLDNKSLAERYSYTPQQISNILNTPEAELIKKLAIERLRRSTLVTVEQRLDNLKLKVVERIEAVINSDEIFEKNPFAVIDRGMKLIEKHGTNTIPDPNANPNPNGGGMVVNGNVIMLPNESVDKLTAAMDRANRVKEIHSADVTVNDGNHRHIIGGSK